MPAPAPEIVAASASRAGYVERIETRRLGLLLAEAGGGRVRADDVIDPDVSLEAIARLGERVEEGQELARLYVREGREHFRSELAQCFELSDERPSLPPLIGERFSI